MIIDVYELNEIQLWRIDIGKNVRTDAHYIPFLVYDFDGNGKAEMLWKTANRANGLKGLIIGNPDAEYGNEGNRILHSLE